MNETKLDEASEKTSLFHSTRNASTGVSNAGSSRDSWRATTSRLFLNNHQRQQKVRPKTHPHLYRHHHYHHLHHKNNQQQQQQASPTKEPVTQQLQRCTADEKSSVHQHHKQILLHHHHQTQSPDLQRTPQLNHKQSPHLNTHLHTLRPFSPFTPRKHKRKKRHLQLTHESHLGGSLTNPSLTESSIVQTTVLSNRPQPVASFFATSSECPHCSSNRDRSQQNQYHHPYTQHYQHQQLQRTGLPTGVNKDNANANEGIQGATRTAPGGTITPHCCGGAHPPSTKTGSGAIITTATPLSEYKQFPAVSDDHIVFIWDTNYFRSFQGIIRLLQVVLSVVSLICLTTAGRKEGGYLSLPLCWHFRIMVFVLVLTLMSSFVIWMAHVTGVASAFPVNWHFLDMVIYSVFAFLYLVGASLVASAFDFYEKMQVGVAHQTIQQLILSVIIGYICLFLYGTTAIIGYRQWRIQMNQYQRRKLLEEDDFEI